MLTVRQDRDGNLSITTLWGREVFSITKKDRGYYITPDLCGGLPIFAYSAGDTLYFANNIDELLEMIPRQDFPEIDKNNVLKLALMQDDGKGDTIFNNLRVFNGLNHLFWDGGPLQLIEFDYPSNQIVPKQSFESLLQQNLSWTKQFKPGEIGVTLSGGVDSAVIWAGLLSLGVKPTALTIMFPGEMGKRQQAKVEQMVKAAQANWLQVYPDNFQLNSKPTALYEDIYDQLFVRLHDVAQQAGVKVVLGGIGGDELAASACYQTRLIVKQTKKLPKFFTPHIVKAWESLLPEIKPNPRLVAASAYNSTGCISGEDFAHNLWFENIFCYPDFWYWSRQQPKSWGENKQGFRDYLKKAGFDLIADSTLNENFHDIFSKANNQFVLSEKFDLLLNHSNLAERGWLNKEEVYNIKNSLDNTDIDTLSNLHFVLSLENMLQYTQYMYQKKGN